MPDFDLPSLGGNYERADEKLKRKLSEALLNSLGPEFSFKNGLNYKNNMFEANLSPKGLSANMPLSGGNLKASIANILDSPRYSLNYSKSFK